MPNISEYLLKRFGIIVYLYYFDEGRHNRSHVHVMYGDEEAVIAIPGGELLEGTLPNRVLRKVRAWIELNDEALMERWGKAVRGNTITRID